MVATVEQNDEISRLFGQQSQGLDLTAPTPPLELPEAESAETEFLEDRTVLGIQIVPSAKRAQIKLARKRQTLLEEQHNLKKLNSMFGISDRVIRQAHTLEGEKKTQFLDRMMPHVEKVFPEAGNSIRTFASNPSGYKEVVKNVQDPTIKALVEARGKTGDFDGALNIVQASITKGKGQTINVGGENALTKAISKTFGKKIVENKELAVKAAASIRTANESIKLLDSGVITGFGAEFITNLGRAVKRLGFDVGTDVENTQAFFANQGKAVLDILGSGALGAGTAISDNDTKFAGNVAGGTQTLDEKSIRRIIALNAKVSKNVIERHNKDFAKIKDKSPVDLKVDLPAFVGRELDPEARFNQIQKDRPDMIRQQILDQMINEGF